MASLYVEKLLQIQQLTNEHFDYAYQMPEGHKFYNIDLDKREIKSPIYLSTIKDHRAENIFFCVDRYFDNIDLSALTCIIQYVNAEGSHGIYIVPNYDLLTQEGKIYFPWTISGLVTKGSGNVRYSVSFYYIDWNTKELVYNLSTQAAVSKVLYGMDFTEDLSEENLDNAADALHKEYTELEREMVANDYVKYIAQLLHEHEVKVAQQIAASEEKLTIYWTEIKAS